MYYNCIIICIIILKIFLFLNFFKLQSKNG